MTNLLAFQIYSLLTIDGGNRVRLNRKPKLPPRLFGMPPNSGVNSEYRPYILLAVCNQPFLMLPGFVTALNKPRYNDSRTMMALKSGLGQCPLR